MTWAQKLATVKKKKANTFLMQDLRNCSIPQNCIVQFTSVPWPMVIGGGGRDMRDNSAEIFFLFFSAGGPCRQFWHAQGDPFFDVVHPGFLLLTAVLPTLQKALEDGFGEAVEACDMPEPWKFPPLDSCQKRFLWAHREAGLAPHPVVRLIREGRATTPHLHSLLGTCKNTKLLK